MLISTTRFRCDACGVISEQPRDWTVIEAYSTDGPPNGTVIHLCVDCKPRLRDLLAWLERGRER